MFLIDCDKHKAMAKVSGNRSRIISALMLLVLCCTPAVNATDNLPLPDYVIERYGTPQILLDHNNLLYAGNDKADGNEAT